MIPTTAESDEFLSVVKTYEKGNDLSSDVDPSHDIPNDGGNGSESDELMVGLSEEDFICCEADDGARGLPDNNYIGVEADNVAQGPPYDDGIDCVVDDTSHSIFYTDAVENLKELADMVVDDSLNALHSANTVVSIDSTSKLVPNPKVN